MRSEHSHGKETTGKSLKRRGILAAAGAVVAGIVAKQTSEPVAAAASMMFANTAPPVTNTALGRHEFHCGAGIFRLRDADRECERGVGGLSD